MEEKRLWRLFFATGLPEAYLALAGERARREERASPPVSTAFRGSVPGPKKI